MLQQQRCQHLHHLLARLGLRLRQTHARGLQRHAHTLNQGRRLAQQEEDAVGGELKVGDGERAKKKGEALHNSEVFLLAFETLENDRGGAGSDGEEFHQTVALGNVDVSKNTLEMGASACIAQCVLECGVCVRCRGLLKEEEETGRPGEREGVCERFGVILEFAVNDGAGEGNDRAGEMNRNGRERVSNGGK